ncbi:hypothetical protein SDC9_196323 [bioreactor metagenome]|uniref:Uncharacterized protein n=1 Tax=bioreactor metagenome TaxID=1076179 RepID=A0A645IBI8_9ZZZZ
MRFWGIIRTDHRVINDTIIPGPLKREVIDDVQAELAINELCRLLDLSRPVILYKHFKEIKNFGRTVFKQPDFMEPIAFDAFEMEIIPE